MGVDLIGLIPFVIAMVGSPGPANLLLMATGARFGVRRSAPLILGITLGKQPVNWAAGLGVLALLAAAPALNWPLRLAAAAYVVWLAWRIAGGSLRGADAPDAPPGFLQGLPVHPLNPKAWAMATAAFAQFTQPGIGLAGIALVACTFSAFQLVFHTAWTWGGGALAAALTGRAERWAMRGLAILTVASVGWALLQ